MSRDTPRSLPLKSSFHRCLAWTSVCTGTGVLDLCTLDRITSLLQHVRGEIVQREQGIRAAMAAELLLVYLLPLITDRKGWTGQVAWLGERCGRSIRATNRALATLRSIEAISTQPAGPRGVRIVLGPLLKGWVL